MNNLRYSFEKAVQVINPWTGNISGIMSWGEVQDYAEQTVPAEELSVWLDEAKRLFNNDQGEELGLLMYELK